MTGIAKAEYILNKLSHLKEDYLNSGKVTDYTDALVDEVNLKADIENYNENGFLIPDFTLSDLLDRYGIKIEEGV